jgi:uncharacterized protein YaiI (UPF0178 family)
MPAIYVDADACPVKDEVMRVAKRHGLAVYLVGNTWMRLGNDPTVHRVVVPEGLDAADNWIAEHAGTGDVAITADIQLAARCLEKGAQVLGPTGKPFTDAGIGMAVAMRDLTAHLRDSGEIRGTAPAFTAKDRTRFLDALERTLQALRRKAAP